MNFSQKQREYLECAVRRWNIKTGATRSGKTYLDYFIIPKRIRSLAGKDGLIVLIGNTRGTLQRNIIEPLRSVWGDVLVGDIRSDGTVRLFGETAHCIGADKADQADRLRGCSVKYCYGDEIVTWNENVFNMLKSRLDKSYSIFDGTCNPDAPGHWFKKFLSSDADIFHQHYTIDDNPFLDETVRDAIKKEYFGTVFYDRYVNGLWVAAEGCVYPLFADDPARFTVTSPPPIRYAVMGVDFGGTRSAHSFTLIGATQGFENLVVLDEFYHNNITDGRLSPAQLESAFISFLRRAKSQYRIYEVFCDSAEQTLIEGLTVAIRRSGIRVDIRNAQKRPIHERIAFFNSLISHDRFRILSHCVHTRNAMCDAVYSSNSVSARDERLDDGTVNIDSLDSMEYAAESMFPAFTLGRSNR
ncbi:MAG: terminase family protein [Oscillospiraceae bacterium]|nr:terminase family protein [Oscillospiraceae bacterium]MBQ3048855.1 terminase family protein [Oscillospiraceae bacterium]MBQ9938424.1 terminase family protein [Oscillospiraceae bacterium]